MSEAFAEPDMRLRGPADQPVRLELDVMRELLPLEGADVLELGCGAAVRTKELAEETGVAYILAAEVDAAAHATNLEKAIPKVEFASFGAESIATDAERFDIVVMLKSLHHVPLDLLPSAMSEIHRVLRPGGLAYISEPVFDGDLNEVIRLFHDEEDVRAAAFRIVAQAAASEGFALEREYFYRSPVAMKSFEQFKSAVIDATHTEHRLSAARLEEVRARFELFKGEHQTAPYRFETPNRVDLLRKV